MIFEKNLRVIKKYHPELATKIEKKEFDNAKVQLQMFDGRILWKYENLEGEILQGSQEGFDAISKDKNLYVVYGLGNGEYISRILVEDPVKELLVYEPSWDMFLLACHNFDLTALFEKSSFSIIVGQEDLSYQISEFFYANHLRYFLSGYFGNFVTPGVHLVPGNKESYVKFAELFRKGINDFTFNLKLGNAHDGYYGLVNSLNNVFKNISNIENFKNYFQGIPCVIIGAGPSVEKALPILKEIQNSVLILATDSMFKVLLESGIEPHLAFCLERAPTQARFFSNIDFRPETTLVAPTLIHPEVFEAFSGNCLAIRRDIGFDRWLYPNEEQYQLGRVVCHEALVVAGILGCSEICLVGIDQAFSPDFQENDYGKHFYFNGASEDMKKSAASLERHTDKVGGLLDVVGYDGKIKKSHYYWLDNLPIFQNLITTYGLNVSHITPVDYGVPIPCTKRKDPEYLLGLEKKEDGFIWTKIKKMNEGCEEANFEKKILNNSLGFVKEVAKKSANLDTEIISFYYRYNPDFEENYNRYADFFKFIDQKRYEISNLSQNLFELIIFPIIFSEHALIEHDLILAKAECKNFSELVDRKIELYRKWCNLVQLWSYKCAIAIENVIKK